MSSDLAAELGFDPTLKKKKKTKKVIPDDFDAAVNGKENGSGDDLFAGLKKEKKKSKSVSADAEAEKEPTDDIAEALGELSLKKKKKRQRTAV